MNAAVQLDVQDGVALMTLSRPETGNAVSQDVADGLLAAALVCESDDKVRSVLLTAQGTAFCVGGDVRAFAEAGDGMPTLVRSLTASLHMAVVRLARMDKPLVTAVNGAAAGAGLGLAVLGDIALAARSAKFTSAYGALGLTPDAGATWLLPRLVGLRQAQRLLLLNERIDAVEAERIGLITQVFEDDALAAEALERASRLAKAPRRAFGRTRGLLYAAMANGLETQLELEAQSIAEAAGSREGREGVAAFVSRRSADFGSI
ncbi:enoyl-CoA hydratase/isomerase family protein [Brevundimonas staleyi]|uniref:Enoyl-CoA hydratase/isomerase family protein n=1 Tax=Brevundimonas staleyi TaxID=74326 RepID=A0ABW0FUW9_9CAUL